MNGFLNRTRLALITLMLMLSVTALPGMAASNVVIAVTGDISKGRAKLVSDLILAQDPLDAVLLVGDTSNAGKTPLESYRDVYKGTYDRLFPKMFPAPGNHDRLSTPPFSGYVEFWGPAAHAPELYYSFDLGGWHIVSLDSVTFRDGGEAADRQLEWLKQDLAANPKKPVIAYWHYPLFSQAKHGGTPAMKPLWEALAAHGPALVFTGHNHVYERFPPLDPEGQPAAAARGIQEFVIGPGGAGVVQEQRPDITTPVSAVFHGDAQHVGFFTLQPNGGFEFTVKAVDANGATTTVDCGSGTLLARSAAPVPAPAPSVQTTQPVFRVDTGSPTEDKPQSKLWYARGSWWALLPRKSGPSLWERSASGWREHPAATAALTGLPGRADVWAEPESVTAVTVATQSLHIVRLLPGDLWTGRALAQLVLPAGAYAIQSATIARDGSGHWWVAADAGTRVCVWHSDDATTWSLPLVLGDGISKDDICLITSLADGVGVVWSDQVRERVVMRCHKNGIAPDQWEPEEIAAAGGRTADDHLHAALSPDGTLWLATKSSLDTVGGPQLVLRVRSRDGTWRNLPYAPRAADLEPSRPAVFLTPDPALVLVGHNVYNKPDRTQGYIEFGRADVDASEVLADVRKVILPAAELKSKNVKDITGPKGPFPADAPWIVLASDRQGRVYEFDLRLFAATGVGQTRGPAPTPDPAQEPSQAVAPAVPFARIKPRVVTEKALHDTDDPAIWIHPADRSKSLIVGTDKDADGALYVYDLDGKIQQRSGGLQRPNNVDIAYGLTLGGMPVDIAVTTERYAGRLRVYTLPAMQCVDQGDLVVFAGDKARAPMGIALYKRPRDGALFAFVGGKSGPREGYIGQYLLADDGTGHVKMTPVREFGAYSGRMEIEAIAVDTELGYVYYSDERFGVRKYSADPDAPDAGRELALFGTEGFKQDHEGIAIYKLNDGTGYIIVSDQKAKQLRIFTREGSAGNPHAHKLVKIVQTEAKGTDGCEVTPVTLPSRFSKGLFVAMSEGRVFHYYGWEDIAGADLRIACPLTPRLEPSNNSRR